MMEVEGGALKGQNLEMTLEEEVAEEELEEAQRC
jgi:hypothetical protein